MAEQMVRAVGRRDRKKAQTRAALRAAAHRLFAEQGYTATTVQQIADAADVSERTFFRYFESKDDLLLPDLEAFFEAIEGELLARPVDEEPLDAYLAAVTAVVRGRADGGGITATAASLDDADQAIVARMVRAFVDWERRLTDLFTQRIRAARPSADPADAEAFAAVAAGVAVGTTRGAMRLIRRRAVPAGERRAVLDAAFAVARAGCSSVDALGDQLSGSGSMRSD